LRTEKLKGDAMDLEKLKVQAKEIETLAGRVTALSIHRESIDREIAATKEKIEKLSRDMAGEPEAKPPTLEEIHAAGITFKDPDEERSDPAGALAERMTVNGAGTPGTYPPDTTG
jgi:chromosome segregation ATPase